MFGGAGGGREGTLGVSDYHLSRDLIAQQP